MTHRNRLGIRFILHTLYGVLAAIIAVLLIPASVRAQNAEQGAQQKLIAADRGLLEAMEQLYVRRTKRQGVL